MPLTVARNVAVPLIIGHFRYFAGWADKNHGKTIPINGDYFCYTRHEPVGVVGQITPWNFPLLMYGMKLGPALATGNTVGAQTRRANSAHCTATWGTDRRGGFPSGRREYSSRLMVLRQERPSPITWTSIKSRSPARVKWAVSSCRRPADPISSVSVWNWAAKSPNIVFADADMEQAIEGCHFALFFNQGQVCCAGSRLFVEEKVYDEFVEKSVARAGRRTVGDPFDRNRRARAANRPHAV